MNPHPNSVRYNDWRQVAVEPLETFMPVMPVSVIMPYYQTSAETLARTLAALEGQTWPRNLFEVVIVDDGSEPPLERPRATPLNLRVMRQERRGFGIARARNTGARAAAHDILLFLDSDMLVEADWIAVHARWHHVVSDVLTLGSFSHVAVDDLDAETIRCRAGSLQDLFSDRPADPHPIEGLMRRTDDLTTRADDIFHAMAGGNFGIGKSFYRLVGGSDESFARWGAEDTELAYRAYTRGGLLVPVRDAFAWHQGSWAEDRNAKARSYRIQHGKAANLIAHHGLRRARTGRIYAVPQYVVTIAAAHHPAERIIETAANILAGRVHDLVVRIETPADDDDERLAWLRDVFGPDPRVRVAPARAALEEFPASPFHVALPAAVAFGPNLLRRLRAGLRGAVSAAAVLPDGSRVSITRAWALHRARRAGGDPSDFGDARTLSSRSLKIRVGAPPGSVDRAASTRPVELPAEWERLRGRARNVHGYREAWSFLKWLAGAAGSRARGFLVRPAPNTGNRRSSFLKYAVRWRTARKRQAARAYFRHWIRNRWRRLVWKPGKPLRGRSARNTPMAGASKPPEAPCRTVVPAFDPSRYNPFGWPRAAGDEVAALGPIARLPPGVEAHRVVRQDDLLRLRRCHHVEDVQAFHADAVTRASDLARAAATGAVVHLADGCPGLRPLLGADLHDLMATGVSGVDAGGRELLSIRMRRAALRNHSLQARARQLGDAPPPLVSILLATRRPERLPQALAAVARQTYPRLELVLALHGEPFPEVDRRVTELPSPAKVLRASSSEPLGIVLNAATEASSGELLTKMDDDDVYGADHVWDLVLAREYSGAQLVGKGIEFVYLAASDRTVHLHRGSGESYQTSTLAGGALLIARDELARMGGWPRTRKGVDQALIKAVVQARGCVYRTHGAGFIQVRHGDRHTWDASDDWFIKKADGSCPGWNPALADLGDLDLPHPAHG